MQDVATHAKRIAVRSVEQVVPKTPEPGRVEETVAVDEIGRASCRERVLFAV